MNKGYKPTYWRSKKDYSTRTFGAVSLPELPEEYIPNDNIFPNQGGTPFCTAYTVTDICGDEDNAWYSAEYQFAKCLEMLGWKPNVAGIDMKTALSIPRVKGLLPREKAPYTWTVDGQEKSVTWQNYKPELDTEAEKNKKAAYFFLEVKEYDAFDSIRIAIWKNKDEKRSIAIGTPWFQEYEEVGPNGIPFSGKRQISWHATAIKGWKKIAGQTYLMCKSWQGPEYGDRGWLYFSRAEINMLMGTPGSMGGMIAKTANDILTIQTGLQQNIAGLLQLVITKMSFLADILFPPKEYQNG